MFDIQRVEIEWAGRQLVLETGRLARQADGAVLATYGETTVLATVVGAKEEKPGIDFFPLTVNYQEKTFAAGKIPGGYFKREGRPTEKETLTSRLIDRPIRPLFAAGYKNETQVVATVLSHDLENDPDIVAMGPSKGQLLIASAAEAAVPASTSESFSPSWDMTKTWIWTSSMNPSGKSGRMGRSMRRIVRISRSFGAPSRLRNPPGNLPAAAVFSR